MKNEKISVIIPIYKVESYIRKCIESVINQSYENLEIILVDDGSPDACGNICDEYARKDTRIKVIHKENSGVSDTRNVGIKNATGDFIGFVDGDDYISSDMFKILYETIKKYNADISIVSYYEMFNEKVIGGMDSNKLDIINKKEAIIELLRDKKIQSYCWNKLFKREMFEKIEFPSEKYFEDMATMIQIFEKANIIARIEKPEYYYARRNDSIIGSKNLKAYNDYVDIMFQKYFYVFEKYPELEPYNAYNFILNAIRLYTIIVSFNLEELYDRYEDVYKLLISLIEKHEEIILKELDNYSKAVLYLMLLDKETSKTAIKEIYNKFQEKRFKGECDTQF